MRSAIRWLMSLVVIAVVAGSVGITNGRPVRVASAYDNYWYIGSGFYLGKAWRNNWRSDPLYDSTYWGCYGGIWSGIYAYSGVPTTVRTRLWDDEWGHWNNPWWPFDQDWRWLYNGFMPNADGDPYAETNHYNARCTRGASDHYYYSSGWVYIGMSSDGFGDSNHPYDLTNWNY